MASRPTGTWVRWAVPAAWVVSSALAGVAAERTAPAKAQRAKEPLSAREAGLVELGRRLFFDPAVSAMGERSCASCHDPEHGFSDRAAFSKDDLASTPRHSQTLIDVDVSMPMHWDGGVADLETVARARLTEPSGGGGGYRSGNLNGLRTLEAALQRDGVGARGSEAERELGEGVLAVPVGGPFSTEGRVSGPHRIQERYANVLGTGDLEANCATALAAYVRSLRSGTSAYDRFAAGDEGALSPSARRGLELFQGRAGCVECHHVEGPGTWPAFRDGRYHNTGVAWLSRPEVQVRRNFPGAAADWAPLIKTLGMNANGDAGRRTFQEEPGLERAFKTPTLRDVARHPPYMHDGAFATLADVVRHYAGGCGDDSGRDRRLTGFTADDGDVADLVAFLEALTSERRPGLVEKAWARRASTTTLAFVDGQGAPLADLEVTLTPAGEPAVSGAVRAGAFVRTTDARGRIQFGATPLTHVRLTLPQGLPVVGGAWVPDSCREATLAVPVSGRARVALVLPETAEAPATLRLWVTGERAFWHVTSGAAAGLPQPKVESLFQGVRQVRAVQPTPWLFERRGLVNLAGERVALYDGWCPAGERRMLFRLSGQADPTWVTLQPDATVRVDVLAAARADAAAESDAPTPADER